MKRMAKQIEKELMKELFLMAQTSKQYLKGEQWAVNAIAMARMILGQPDIAFRPRKGNK